MNDSNPEILEQKKPIKSLGDNIKSLGDNIKSPGDNIKSPGDNINYLKIYLYKNNALLKEF